MIEEHYSKIQKEVYAISPGWINANNKYIKNVATSSGTYTKSDWNNDATAYANQVKTTASITNNTDSTKITKELYQYNGKSYLKIGPYNFTYSGTYSSSTVYDQNDKAVAVKYGSYSGSTLKVYDTINNASQSGKDFYILAPADGSVSKINKITATVSQSSTKITTEVWILQYSNYQNIISTDSKTETEDDTADVVIDDDIELMGNLSIEKVDKDNSNTKLAGVGFILKNSNTGKYVKQVNNTITYVDKSNATEFVTDSSGKIEVNNLLFGTYIVYETKNPSYGYENVSSSNPLQVGQVKVPSTTTLKITNEKKTGNIKIDKIDYDANTKLEGVTFLLKNSSGAYIIVNNQKSITGNVYVTEMSTTNNKNSATKFVTDKNGNISIINILLGTYTLEEISIGNSDYGYSINKDNIEWSVNGTNKGKGLSVAVQLKRQKSTNTQNNTTLTTSNADSIIVKNIKQTGNIKIVKRDYDVDTKIAGVEFVLKNSKGEYIIVNNQKSVTGNVYVTKMSTTTKNSATKFITDNSGNISIINILLGTYRLEETTIGDYGYILAKDNIEWSVNGKNTGNSLTATVEVKRQKSTNTQNKTTLTTTNADSVIVKNIKQTGNIKILKKDPDNGKVLEGMSFILKASNGQYVIAVDERGRTITQKSGKTYLSNIKYTRSESQATKFITDDKGSIIISNLLIDDYKLIEYSVGNKYYGYEVDKDYITWEVGGKNTTGKEMSLKLSRQTSNNTTSNSNITDSNSQPVTVKNKRKYIKLSGYVWEDIYWEEGKNLKSNELYKEGSNDKEDKLLQNVTVKLKNNSGKVVQSAVTDSKGEYLFENVIIDDLPNLYVEFTYNGMSYQCVDLIDLQKDNASKAKEGDNRTKFNNTFSTISNSKIEYKTENHKSTVILGNSLKYGYNGAKYPISGVYTQYEIQSTTKNALNGGLDKIKKPEEIRKNSIEEVENINLGLKEREQPDMAVVKDIYAAKVSLQGDEYIYLYEDRLKAQNQNKEEIYNLDPQVKFGQERGKQTYTRALYASDIKYSGTNELAVKVIYRIGIHNQSTNLKMKVNQVVDYFDTKYELESAIAGTGISRDGTQITGQVQVSNKQGYNNEYSKVTINPNITLEPQTEAMIYLELTVKKQNLSNIVDIGEEVKLDNIVEISSYSTLDRSNKAYAGIDEDSQPGNTVPGNASTYEDDTDVAPGILMVLQEQRSTEGTVFEDQITQNSLNNGTRQGSGSYDAGELGIAGIEVKVINEADGNIAKVYDSTNRIWKDATAITDSQGKYNIGGFVPGKYHIVYTWGGQEYTLSNGAKKTITVQDYKGTIVNKQAHTAKETNEEWYKDEFKQRFSGIEWQGNKEIRVSDAIDNYDQRKNIDAELTEITYETKQQGNTTSKIESNTPSFKIGIEYSNAPIDASEEYELNADGSPKIVNGYIVKKEGYKNTIKSIDFGIVERPRQTLALKKEVKNIKLVLANGTTLFEAQIENGALVGSPNYVTYIPEGNANKAQLKMEIDNEIVQGATLEITYAFTVENKSEIDYNTQEYYLYGPRHGEDASKLVTLEAKEIIDYIDNEIAVDMNTNSQWKLLSEQDINNYKGKLLADTSAMQNYLNTIDRKIVTNELNGQKIKPGEKISTLNFVTSKYLANNEETYLENHAEIIKVAKNGGSSLTTTPGNYVPTDLNTSEVDNGYAEELNIVPPTGTKDNTISYVILAISTLSMLVVGIILIKRVLIK